mmetsp:Transcript_44431/g.100461  ORF Transcript_44431/g.100461 Transcript_44431/m.100461 type:complete len:259 (+) Transcript_44431:1022-1798(+)
MAEFALIIAFVHLPRVFIRMRGFTRQDRIREQELRCSRSFGDYLKLILRFVGLIFVHPILGNKFIPTRAQGLDLSARLRPLNCLRAAVGLDRPAFVAPESLCLFTGAAGSLHPVLTWKLQKRRSFRLWFLFVEESLRGRRPFIALASGCEVEIGFVREFAVSFQRSGGGCRESGPCDGLAAGTKSALIIKDFLRLALLGQCLFWQLVVGFALALGVVILVMLVHLVVRNGLGTSFASAARRNRRCRRTGCRFPIPGFL